jgi:hypothetical protein
MFNYSLGTPSSKLENNKSVSPKNIDLLEKMLPFIFRSLKAYFEVEKGT